MPVLTNISQLCLCPAEGGQSDIDAVSDAALVWEGDTILWTGHACDIPADYESLERLDCTGRLVVPGLVDCHTHLAFGGWRGDEFEMRIQGKSYLDIAKAGGGIASTVAATREASKTELVEKSLAALAEMARLGVTTVECKSGYGLDETNEIKLLEVYAELAVRQPLRIVPTFLGAHIVPEEYKDDRDGYVRLLTETLIPRVATEGLATFCDVFVEDSAFSLDEAREILSAAAAHGLGLKVHADQLSDTGAAGLAGEMKAVSAEHLEYANSASIEAMSNGGTVAVSLPIANLYLGQQPFPAREFIDAGVPVAVATDFNPGSSPSYHLPLGMTLACLMQKMTPAESLKGATVIAARALSMEDTVGSLEPGMKADFAVIEATDVNHWLYHFRPDACVLTVVDGNYIADSLGEVATDR